MLPKPNRLKKKKDFDQVHQRGRFYRGRFAAIKVLKNDLPETRIGIIVSTKVSKKAVVRNQVKRRIRAVILEFMENLEAGYDVVVLVRPEIATKDYQEIKLAIRNLFQDAKLIKD